MRRSDPTHQSTGAWRRGRWWQHRVLNDAARHKLEPVFLESLADRLRVVGNRSPQSALEVRYRGSAHPGLMGQVLLRPRQQSPGSLDLFKGYVVRHSNIIFFL